MKQWLLPSQNLELKEYQRPFRREATSFHVRATQLAPVGDPKCTGQGKRITPSSPGRMSQTCPPPSLSSASTHNECFVLPQSV